MSQTDLQRAITLKELALSPYFSIINVHLVDINVFAKFYEILSLPFQYIEKPKCRRRTNAHMDGQHENSIPPPPSITVCREYNELNKVYLVDDNVLNKANITWATEVISKSCTTITLLNVMLLLHFYFPAKFVLMHRALIFYSLLLLYMSHAMRKWVFGSFRTGQTQTGLLSYTS